MAEEVYAVVKQSTDHVLYPLLPIFEEEELFEEEESSNQEERSEMLAKTYDCRKTLEVLGGSKVLLPAVDKDLWRTYFSYLSRSGFLRPAQETRLKACLNQVCDVTQAQEL